MNLKIYQSFYEKEQIHHLNDEFVPYDNTSNLTPHFREYPHLKHLFQMHRNDNLHWGLVSWKWKQKTYLEPSVFKKWILDNPGYDVYHFDPYLEVAATCTNLWTQDGMTDFANLLFPKIGINHRCEDFFYRGEDFATCNFLIGNSNFWTNWFLYIDDILVKCSQDVSTYEYVYRQGRNYLVNRNNVETKEWLPNFIFVIERLTSLFFIQHRHIKVKKFPSNHDCYTLQYGKEKHMILNHIYDTKNRIFNEQNT